MSIFAELPSSIFKMGEYGHLGASKAGKVLAGKHLKRRDTIKLVIVQGQPTKIRNVYTASSFTSNTGSPFCPFILYATTNTVPDVVASTSMP